jgi:probable phosphoglycerate mutase
MPRARRPAPTVLLLVRHALTATTGMVLPGRAPGLGLSDEGRRQAARAAARIAALPRVSAVYASPLERARETAAAIARARRLAVRIERDLVELDPGAWTGWKLETVRRRPEWQVVRQCPSAFRFPGGESFVEMQARMAAALARLAARHPGQVVVAVSHADPIKAAVAHALGMRLDLFQRLLIAPASVTAVAWRRERPLVLTVNSVDGDLAALLRR